MCPGCQVQRSSRRVRAGRGGGGAAPGRAQRGGRGPGPPPPGGRAGGRAGMRVSVCACAGADLAEGMLRAEPLATSAGPGRTGGGSCGPASPAGTKGRSPNRHRCFLQEDSAGLRETRPRLPHLPALWLAFPFVLCPECLFTPGHLGSFSPGRARARRRWIGGRWAGARGCWGSPWGRAPAGVAAREGRGRRWRDWRGGVSRLPRSPALSSSSSGSLHPLQAPSGAGTSIPPPSGMRSALFSAALQRGFPRLRPPHSFMFFLLATVFTLFDRVLFLHLVVYISFPKEWLLTPPCRYGAAVFDNNHFSTSDLNVGWTARDRGWRLQNRVAQSCYRLGICIFYIYAWEADGVT